MLFNSYEFIFLFLPLTFILFFLISQVKQKHWALVWLIGASLFFYAWWNSIYLFLLLSSILLNYFIGLQFKSILKVRHRKWILVSGISFNLGLIGFYKYSEFIVLNINAFIAHNIFYESPILPLAISFFTFQQIAYLVDAYRGEIQDHNFLNYCLFVSFFPQLIAGPIVHHGEILPQLRSLALKIDPTNVASGLTLFFIGLFKKVAIADQVAVYANNVFNAAKGNIALTLIDAWGGTLAYTFQLYFDFSGYSDMAIGLGLMFGIRLPINFNSPYKANNIIDFWRRWHMTLSRFLRDYLYIPLGGNKKGESRRYINLMTTMLLGGLWHGAGWTFIIWGGLHGLYLTINHIWGKKKSSIFPNASFPKWLTKACSRSITFLLVALAWVFFRAEHLDDALNILMSMFGFNGFTVEGQFYSVFEAKRGGILLLVLLAIVWYAPNSQQIMAEQMKFNKLIYNDKLIPWKFSWAQWQPNVIWAVIMIPIITYAIFRLSRVTEFLYFNF